MATDVETTAAESSSATSTSVPAAPVDLSTLTREQRQTWRETGTVPGTQQKPTNKDASAASEEGNEEESSDADGEQAAGESAPASEAGKDAQGNKNPKRGDAATRIATLLAENKKLKEAAKTAPKTEVKADPSPAAALEPPKKPNPKDFEGKPYEEFEAAYDKYIEDLTDFKANKAVQQQKANDLQQQRKQKLEEKMAEARTRYGENYDTVIQPTMKTLTTELDKVPAVAEMIGTSPVFEHLLYVIGEDEAALADFIKTAKADPALAIRKAIALENGIMTELSKGKTAKAKESKPTEEADEAEEADESAEGLQRDPKTGKFLPVTPETTATTRLPKPISEVAGRGTTSDDPLRSAAQAKDMRSFKRESTRQYLAKAKNG
jgi:hypothetical protein